MILVTVGTQLAFDRMVRAVDEWAASHRDVEVFAQIGPAEYLPQYIAYERFVGPELFTAKARACTAMVAHAGTGSIFTALELKKPIIVMPRRAELAEHRNDHQLATVAKFRELEGVHVAENGTELHALLDRLDRLPAPADGFSLHAQPELLAAVRAFVEDDGPPRPRTHVLRSLLRVVAKPRARGR
jgi:UDP-N-acetylglucosamine transferase subunit ALG13